uniref:Uncharacterized protein n=1 Tax=Siphoviridae sp. ct5jB2 TaxID=2825337 RepID=A0A8S5TTQ2_9CAUD|nr:MAG TPA: hypothetical protein [Siphoviridae sp. ct5jB2]
MKSYFHHSLSCYNFFSFITFSLQNLRQYD